MAQCLNKFWGRLSHIFRNMIGFISFLKHNHGTLLCEEERLLAELKTAQDKLTQAWFNLQYAEKKYVDIAIMEINLAETEYSLLCRKYKLITGETEHMNDQLPNFLTLPWLGRSQNPPFSGNHST